MHVCGQCRGLCHGLSARQAATIPMQWTIGTGPQSRGAITPCKRTTCSSSSPPTGCATWRDGRALRRALLAQRPLGADDRLRRLQPGQPGEVLPAPGADQDAQRPLLRRPAGEGAVPRLPQRAAAGQAAGGAGQEPVPAQLRRQPQLHAHVHARRPDGQRRRRHAAVRADGAQPRVARPTTRSAAAGCTRPARTATAASRSTSSRRSSTCWASPPARCRTTTSAASCSSTPRWTWRPTPPRGWRGRTR